MKLIIGIIQFIIILNFISCSIKDRGDLKVKYIGSISTLYGSMGNIEDYNDKYEVLFTKTDTLNYVSLKEDYLEMMKKGFGEKENINGFKFEMTETKIKQNLQKYINNEEVCCYPYELEYFVENIGNKKYLFSFFNDEITTVDFYKIDSNETIKERRRESYNLPTWNIKLGHPISEKYFLDTTIISESKIHKSIEHQQLYLLNRNLKLTTIKFPDFKDRIVVRVENKITENELNDFLELIKTKYNSFTLKDTTTYDDIFKEDIRKIQLFNNGYHIDIKQINTNFLSSYEKRTGVKYDIKIMDLYELTKNLISRKGHRSKIIFSSVSKNEGDLFNPNIKSIDLINKMF